MTFFKARGRLVEEVDYVARFSSDINSPKALYGLPRRVSFCRKCVISNQRPNSTVEFENTKKSTKSNVMLTLPAITITASNKFDFLI